MKDANSARPPAGITNHANERNPRRPPDTERHRRTQTHTHPAPQPRAAVLQRTLGAAKRNRQAKTEKGRAPLLLKNEDNPQRDRHRSLPTRRLGSHAKAKAKS